MLNRRRFFHQIAAGFAVVVGAPVLSQLPRAQTVDGWTASNALQVGDVLTITGRSPFNPAGKSATARIQRCVIAVDVVNG